MYNRSTQDAISALSLLAEVYDGGQTVLSSADIAEKRNLPKPFVAKLLTVLSQARFVTSNRGPGGGYWLAVPPDQITFYDIARLFEREESSLTCPFGRGYCGSTGNPCPLHGEIEDLQNRLKNFLLNTRFDIFQKGTGKSKTEKTGKL